MRPLTAEHLRQVFPALPRSKARDYAPHFSAAVQEGQINTRKRLCAFVAELGHESLDLKHLREIWGPTPAQVRYDVRTDLGNTPERDGDGKLYMGRGGIQRTGKQNYRRFEEATGVPVLAHPDLLERPEYAFRSDVLYWTDNKLNKLADKLTLRGDAKDLAKLDEITLAINGGYNGRVDRQRRYLVAIANLPDELFTTEPPPSIGQQSALDTLNARTQDKPAAAPAQPKTTHKVLIEKLSKNEAAKTAGITVLRRFGLKIATPAGLLVAALGSGNVYAWLAVFAILIIIAGIAYTLRRPIRRAARSLLNSLEKTS